MLSVMMSEQPTQAVVHHFTLPGILPEGQTLALQRNLGILALIAHEEGSVRMLASLRFTPNELAMLYPLLDSFPDYCPYEVLHAYYHGNAERVSGEAIDQSRTRLQRTMEQGTFEAEMRPLRNVISRVRLRLHDLGIDVVSMLETGYLVRKKRGTRRRRSEQEKRGRTPS